MKTKLYSLFAIVTFSVTAWSQGISISQAGEEADESAILDIQSTEKGFLPPRMTTVQRNGITSPATGLIIYNTDDDCIQVNNGTPGIPNWECLGAAATPVYQNVTGKVTTFSAATYTLDAEDYLVISNFNVATTLTLPALTAADAGRTIRVIADNTATVSVTVSASPTPLPFGSLINNLRGRDYVWTGTRWLAITL